MSMEFEGEWNPTLEIVENHPEQWQTIIGRVIIEEPDEPIRIRPVRRGRRGPIIEEPFDPIPMSEDELIRDYESTINENQTIEVRMTGYQAPVTLTSMV